MQEKPRTLTNLLRRNRGGASCVPRHTMAKAAHVTGACFVAALCAVGIAQECYGPNERSQGQENFPAVEYKPCCDGQEPVSKNGEWGRFCPSSSGNGDGENTPYNPKSCGDAGQCGCSGEGYPVCGKCPADTGSPWKEWNVCYCAGLTSSGVGGVECNPLKVNGPFKKQDEDVSTPGVLCYMPGERNQGAAGFPQVDYKPCCDGAAAVDKAGDWGKFCPGGTGGGGGGDNCYAPGERNQGAAGFPQVDYKPCCDGAAAVDKAGDWGKFCPGGTGGSGGGDNCYAPGERNQGAENQPPVEYKPCCDGRQAISRSGDWGLFCPEESTSIDTTDDTACYGEGELDNGSQENNKQCCEGLRPADVAELGQGRFCIKINLGPVDRYDLNGDGVVDEEDLLFLFRSFSDPRSNGPLTEIPPSSVLFDFNDDGNFDIRDMYQMTSDLNARSGPDSVYPSVLQLLDDAVSGDILSEFLQADHSSSAEEKNQEAQPQGFCDERRLTRWASDIQKGTGQRPQSTNWDEIIPDDFESLQGTETTFDKVAYYFWKAAVWGWTGLEQVKNCPHCPPDNFTEGWALFERNYFHYLGKSGTAMSTPYQLAIDSDDSIRRQVDEYVDAVKRQLGQMHEDGEDTFQFHSVGTAQVFMGISLFTPWEGIIGTHSIWAEGTVVYDAAECRLDATIIIKFSDLYDFPEKDLPLLRRFARLGWARRFTQTGQSAPRYETIPLDCCENQKCATYCECHKCVAKCQDEVKKGAQGLNQKTEVEMGVSSGTFEISYNMKTIKDKMTIFHRGKQIYSTSTAENPDGLVSGRSSAIVSFGEAGSTDTIIEVVMDAPEEETEWDFTVKCPRPLVAPLR